MLAQNRRRKRVHEVKKDSVKTWQRILINPIKKRDRINTVLSLFFMLKIEVTVAHIAAAKPYSHQSPIALALQELGYTNATCNHRFVYINGKPYELPEAAIANEIRFDFIAKSGKLQGEVCDQITPFDFELPTPLANP
jgi:hypothetical protein